MENRYLLRVFVKNALWDRATTVLPGILPEVPRRPGGRHYAVPAVGILRQGLGIAL